MIDPKTKKILEELGESDYGEALKEYLDERLKSMEGNVHDYENWDDILGRRKATRIIKEIFYFLEKREIKQKDKNQYV